MYDLYKEWCLIMKLYKNYLAFALAFLAFSFGSVNANSFTDVKPGRTLEQNVQRQILRMPRYEVFDLISFKVEGSTVTLSGKIRNAINKREAERRIEDLPGVTRVINNIEILPVGGFDESIRRNLYVTLANEGGLSRYLWATNPSVRLIVERGRITLAGYVANRGDYNLMNILANGVSGAFSVTNDLVIDDGKAR